jgi:outer membrane protein W
LCAAILAATTATLARPTHAAEADSLVAAPAADTLVAVGAAEAPAVAPAPASVDAWARGRQWVSVRAGYAKAASKFSADGNLGGGFAYSRFLSRKWALTAAAHYDNLGKFGGASEIEIPFTLELDRHFQWATPARPYLGFGTGAFFHKSYRTGADESDVRKGVFFSTGVNSAISDESLIGLDVRTLFEFDAVSHNPVFINEEKSTIHWGVKVGYSRFF